jgi:hypothetical protein
MASRKIIIFFPAGGFGSTIEYCIRKFSKEFETIETQVLDDGSMHGFSKEAHLIWHDKFELIKTSSGNIFTPVYPNLNHATVKETILQFKSFNENSKVIFITLDNEAAVEKNEFFGFYKIPNKIILQSKLENIRQWNSEYKTVSDMQRWELREYLSLTYEDFIPMMTDAHTLSESNWLNLNPQNLLDNFEETVQKIIKYSNLTFDDEKSLHEFSKLWLSKQQYIIDKHTTMQTIFENTVQNKSLTWDSLDIISESLLQYKFKKRGMTMKCFGLNSFPTSTKSLMQCFE